jgi:Kef-type K+ transport system membrane component KefB
MGLGMASGSASSIKSALAVGASFSPTSLGVAASALKSGKMLDTPVGQLIVASCVVDDVLALILLSMFKVLVKDNPPIIEYFIPIISSLGFLIVLGGSAVTWMPQLIEEKILKKCSEPYRDLAMFSVMSIILLAYLPLLNYTQASYLTGAFLCGCIFSQIEHAHHTFMEKTHQLMTWLLRVFFAASIGFPVPVKQFGDPYVIGWGFILYLCVAAKLPLAFYVPQFEDVKKGASYNPFLRDRLIAALAMTCRGEFSFIIAAFALGEGLFTAQMYAAIVWAVLLSCISSPFMLLNLIKYFNKLQMEYLASTNPIKLAKDADGVTPLFLHIKAKAAAFGGMQEQFRKIVNELGLEVVERRTNRNGRGLNATVQTDLYVRDKTMTVQLQKIAAQKKIKRALASALESSGSASTMNQTMSFCKRGSIRPSSNNLSALSLKSLEKGDQEAIQAAAKEEDEIIKRGNLVEKKIEEALGEGSDVSVDVWNPWPWTEVLDKICAHYGATDISSKESIGVFVAIFDKIDADGGGSIDQEEMYEALADAGLEITEEGVITLFAMIDEDGNGDIDRDEWKETVEFYLELKEDEAEIQNQQADHAEFMKKLRAKKLAKLGQTGQITAKEPMKTVAEGEQHGTEMVSNYKPGMEISENASDDFHVGLDIDA